MYFFCTNTKLYYYGVANTLLPCYVLSMKIPFIVKKTKKVKHPKPKKQKQPFINDKEWDELDEEDEECMYIDED